MNKKNDKSKAFTPCNKKTGIEVPTKSNDLLIK